MSGTTKKTLPRWGMILIVAAILAASVVPVFYHIIGPARGGMTSDTTDSLLWAYRAYKTGKAADPDFSYAAILPFGGNQIFFPFVAMFGYSMTAQICGLCFFALLFFLALWFFFSGLGLSPYRTAGAISASVLILSSSPKLREILWEHIFYYNLGVLFFCFGFGLAFRLLDVDRGSEKPRRVIAIVSAVCLGLFSLFAATDGLQTLVCFSLPLIAALFFERLFSPDELPGETGKRSLWLILFVGGLSGIGLLLIKPITGGVTAAYQEAYSTWSAPSQWSTNLLGFFPNWFSLLGVDAAAGDPLAGIGSILNMLRILGGILLLALPVALLVRWKTLGRRVRMALVGHFAVSAFILFAVVFGSLGGANWRLVPMLGTSALLSAVAVSEIFNADHVRRRIAVCLLAVFCLLAALPFGTILSTPARAGRDNSWYQATAALEEHGLRYGYANFWWAEQITLISGGKLEVANIREWESTPKPYRYQCAKDAFDDKDDADSYFLLLTEDENAKMRAWIASRRTSGDLLDEFTVDVPYDLRGHTGERLYVYVFATNLFSSAG